MAEQVKEMDSKMEKVKDFGIPVVPVEFFEEVKAQPSSAMMLFAKKNIAKWDCPELEKRVAVEQAARESNKSGASGSKSGECKFCLFHWRLLQSQLLERSGEVSYALNDESFANSKSRLPLNKNDRLMTVTRLRPTITDRYAADIYLHFSITA